MDVRIPPYGYTTALDASTFPVASGRDDLPVEDDKTSSDTSESGYRSNSGFTVSVSAGAGK